MSRFFVQPDVARLELEDGEWIEVKSELTFAEERRLAGAGLTSFRNPTGGENSEIGIDWERFALARIEMWLLDWSFRDAKGKPVAVSKSAIANLTPAAAQAITEALDRHVAALEAAKKATSTPAS